MRSLAAAFALLSLLGPAAHAQRPANPVYVDDSPAAAEGLSRAEQRLASGNLDEAARLLQELLLNEGDRLAAHDDNPDLFVNVRRLAIETLLDDEALLETYRRREGPRARAMLEEGDVLAVERAYLLTSAGFDAALRLARRRLESARFAAARHALVQLEEHPDRNGDRAIKAARLLGRVARYLQGDGAQNRAQRWLRDAGADDASLPEPISPPDLNAGQTPLSPGPELNLSDVVAQPLSSQALPHPPPEPDESEQQQRRRRRRASPDFPPLYVLPTIAGDAIYVNDGYSLSAWDRFTLDPKWRVTFAQRDESRRGQIVRRRSVLEDTTNVSVFGPWAVAPGGVARSGTRHGDSRLHAVDAYTGRKRWSVDLASLDPTLEDATIRGPAIIDQGVVVVALTKQVRQRRLISAHLAGLELATGRLLWTRSLGSTGSRPYSRGEKVGEIPVVEGGVVYRSDAMGFVAAVESVTGRIRWIRRRPVEPDSLPPQAPWAGASPVVHDQTVYTVSPDRRRILALQARSGRLVGARDSAPFGSPDYLLKANGTLLAVGGRSVTAIRFDRFEDSAAKPRTVLEAEDPGVRGRVVVAGDRVVAPVEQGLLVAEIDARISEQASMIPLDRSGNLVAARSQLVVADASAVHSYLLWDVAERLLAERMEQNPSDPGPAVTFVQLAYRAGKADQIAPAADAALRSIEKAPLEERNRRIRERLFESLHAMLTSNEDEQKDDERTGAALSREQRKELIMRLGRAAASPEQRVKHLLAKGAFHEAAGQGRAAAQAHQRILDQSTLASARIERKGVSVRAEAEATAALRRVVRRFGPEVYSPLAEEARRALAEVDETAPPERYTEIARRYPVSKAAARAWLEAASAYTTRGRSQLAAAALEDGLAAAEDALVEDRSLLGELAGRLATTLAESGRLEAAAALASRLRDDHPDLSLTSEGETLDLEAFQSRVRQRLAARDRRPTIGRIPDEPGMQMLAGWRLASPLIDRAPTAAAIESVMLRSDSELALWTLASDGGLEKRWAIPDEPGASLLTLTAESAFVTKPSDHGPAAARIDVASGEEVWSAPPFRELAPQSERANKRLATDEQDASSALRTPMGVDRPYSEVLVAMEHRALVLVERTGRAVALDLETGRMLWTKTETVDAVYDIALSSGTLLVVGDDAPPSGENADGEVEPTLAALDLRTGRQVQRATIEAGSPRWARLTSGELAVVGAEDGVVAFDLVRARRAWSLRREPFGETLGAWTFPDRIIVVAADGTLHQIGTGASPPQPRQLDTRNRFSLSGPAKAAKINSGAAFSTAEGLTIFDAEGRLVGVDRRADESPLLPAAFGRDRIVALTDEPSLFDQGGMWYDLHVFTADSAAMAQRRAVRLGAPPEKIALLDGRVLITAGDATLVIDAPPTPKADANAPQNEDAP